MARKKSIKYVLLEEAYFISVDLVNTIRMFFPDFRLVAVIDAAKDLENFLQTDQISFIIADIDSNPKGFVTFMERKAPQMPVILISAFPEYRLFADKINITDFLMKPVLTERLREALLKFYPSLSVI